MRILLTIFALLFISLAVKSQDIIVTNANDSIDCSINYVGKTTITFYRNLNDNRQVLQSLPMADVSYFAYNFNKRSPRSKSLHLQRENQFDVFAGGGLSYFTFKKTETNIPQITDYEKGLKWGNHFQLGLNYYFQSELGLNVTFSHANTSSTIEDVTFYYDNGDIISGDILDEFSFNSYLAKLVYSPASMYSQNYFRMSFGFGITTLTDNALVLGTPGTLKGNTFSSTLGIGGDFEIGNNVYLFMDAQLISAIYSKFDVSIGGNTHTETYIGDDRPNYSRIDFALGIKVSL